MAGRFVHLLLRSAGFLLFIAVFNHEAVVAFPYQKPDTDSLPTVFNDETDVLHALYRHRALSHSKKHQLPGTLPEWNRYRDGLKQQIIKNAGVKYFPDLPFDVRETGTVKGNGFTIKNIYFQTRPGVYATANLYVPEGTGTFPAVLVMMGHSSNGKLYENYQLVGQSLARDGYVALCIDPWGAGERSTVHGEFEYHGTALGASLLAVGETLMGMQLTDNIRAIGLLSSLPFVDKNKIGATGASGGGNQTMWLAALDERVKAAMPVVSVGTFDSYVMAHNCVCEVLPNGLTFSEEWGVLGLVAPRAIKMCNHSQESNPTFFPSEMKKSFAKAKPVFALNGVSENIGYEVMERPHGYFPENREALLGWMDLHLKGTGDGKPRKEKSVEALPLEQLMVFEKGKRDALVHSTESFNRMTGDHLRKAHGRVSKPDVKTKRLELQKLLASPHSTASVVQHNAGREKGWDRVILETGDGRLIPVLLRNGKGNDFVIVSHSEGKKAIPLEMIRSLIRSGRGVAIVDFSGTGEAYSGNSARFDNLGRLHTYGRASLWLGETVTGNWVAELGQVEEWLRKEQKAASVSFYGFREAGPAGVFYAATGGNLKEVHTYSSPASYLFDTRRQVEHFGVGIYIPGVLHWGDLSLAAGLGESDLFLHEPVTMSGRILDDSEKEEIRQEYDRIKAKTGTKGKNTVL